MNEDSDPIIPGDDAEPESPTAVEVAVLRKRSRRLGIVAGGAAAVAALLGGLLVVQRGSDDDSTLAGSAGSDRPGAAAPSEVEAILASLDDSPVDPTKVKLVSTVTTFGDCDSLVDDLRRVGAQHVGSRGFGTGYPMPWPYGGEGDFASDEGAPLARTDSTMAATGELAATGGDTIGTNVQVAGVDELDFVKAVGSLIYDLDGRGNLRITDVTNMDVLSTLDVTPELPGSEGDDPDRDFGGGTSQVSQLLVADGRAAIFGTEYEVSDPIPGDPSATQATTVYMTVTFVDVSDPAAPKLTDRIRVEGSLVSARLVDGEVRMVTTSNMADLGFVLPTTPNSVSKALEMNRRSVAGSAVTDWIPDWQRTDEDPTPLVPCERVHVPETFAGVAMTSMVTFPLGSGRFEPAGTSILAPASTLYAGLEKVAISSEVWVDPIDRDRLEFENWQTAVHEFSFADTTAPTYEGSGIVDGSTIGQFAFGEIADAIAVVTTKGTPWRQDPSVGVDLTIFTPDGSGNLEETAKIADISSGSGAVTAVRFIEGRVLISTGIFGREMFVIDVSDPAAPRKAGNLALAGTVGYFHPLPDQQALVVGSREDEVGEGNNRQMRTWVQTQLIDVSNAESPTIVGSWERPWSGDNVGYDHHAFTYWPARKLAMWGIYNTQWDLPEPTPNIAVVLGTEGALTEVAAPVANRPNEVPPPCPIVEVSDPDARNMIGSDSILLRCGDKDAKEIEWPRYQCWKIDDDTLRMIGESDDSAAFFACNLAPLPSVSRVLIVDGKPILYTDQTLEVLDPATFQSTAIVYHPSAYFN